jgi:hypothetical protein
MLARPAPVRVAACVGGKGRAIAADNTKVAVSSATGISRVDPSAKRTDPLTVTAGGGHAAPLPHPESLLVLYLGDEDAVQTVSTRLGVNPIAPANPYWAGHELRSGPGRLPRRPRA